MAQPGTAFGAQKLIFDEVVWKNPPAPSTTWNLNQVIPVKGAPPNVIAGGTLLSEAGHPPYWEFSYQLNNTTGLSLSNIVVRDSQGSGSTEDVFDSIDFTDFSVTFTDNTVVPFNLARAFTNPGSSFSIVSNGTRQVGKFPPDAFFQRGLKLTLQDNVLTGSGTCNVVLELSVAFRGANNDIDPGGVPVGMKLWPQLAYTWQNSKATSVATKKVMSFMGTVRWQVKNKMYSMGGMGGMGDANIASMFSDSNTSMNDQLRGNILTGHDLKNFGAIHFLGAPIGWGEVFDYAKLNITMEIQKTAVTSPLYKHIVKKFLWPDSSDFNVEVQYAAIEVDKAIRQATYDNVHIHARMPNRDSEDNIQIHAPFCGHSCLHAHWRWSSFSSDGATDGRGWAFRGWSSGVAPTAYSTDNAPMVPPNQTVTIALTKPNATRFSNGSIINPTPQPLDPLHKMTWYNVLISSPNADEKQVTVDHGIGWAYRYATTLESLTVLGLVTLVNTFSALTGLGHIPTTQQEVSDFFEKDLYPFYRYFEFSNKNGQSVNQIPDGDYFKTLDQTDTIPMERI